MKGFTLLGMLLACSLHASVARPDPSAIEKLGQLTSEAIKARQAGDTQQAIEAARRAHEYAEATLGADDPLLASVFDIVGGIYSLYGEPDRAEALIRRGLTMRERAKDPDDRAVARSLTMLARVLANKGNFRDADAALQRALALSERALGPEHILVAFILAQIAELDMDKGDYTGAARRLERVVAIQKRNAGGPDDPKLANAIPTALADLGKAYGAAGDYARAMPVLDQALADMQKAEGAESNDLSAVALAQANLYESMGDYTRAEAQYRRILASLEKAHDPGHQKLATALNGLASCHVRKGNGAQAAQLYQQALHIMEKAFGPDHPDVAHLLISLAFCRMEVNDLSGAEQLFKRGLAVIERSYGKEHYQVAEPLYGLARVSRWKGEFALALALGERVRQIVGKTLNSKHIYWAGYLDQFAKFYWAVGDIEHAKALQAEARSIEDHRLSLTLTTGSERQKKAYVDMLASAIPSSISLHLDAVPFDTEAARTALAALLRRKGLVLDAEREGFASLRNHLTPEARTLQEEQAAVRTQLANQVNQGPGRLAAEKYRTHLAELEAEADRLEEVISSQSAQFRVENQPVSLEQIQQVLPESSALIEVALYRSYNAASRKAADEWGKRHYAAYVLFPKGEPKWAELGEAQPIDQAIDALRAALRKPASRPLSRGRRSRQTDVDPTTGVGVNPARILDELVMRPIRKLLGETRTVFFSPDGALNLIPLGALVDENGRALIEDYHITYLTSGRDLLRLQLEHDAKGQSVVLADPDFGAAGAKSKQGISPDRGRRSAKINRGTLHFGPLLGTQPLTRAHATETALKQVHQPSVLHIATHGFFLPDQPQEPSPPSYQGWDDSLPAPAPRTENPLLRSGLALAGANTLQSGNEDGLLTALEASGLDLWGTQLVVLSACETGVGKVQIGEGVYGLRRALVNAGAQTQVMSLWKVDDAATRDLMTDYYRRLNAGEGRSEALRQAQLTMLHSKHQNDPYYWASFIVSGDWRELRNKAGSSARQ